MITSEFRPERCGLYRLPARAEKLRQAANDAGLAWFDVELSHVQQASTALETFASAMAFPKTFGQNWDALADSLQDLSWRPAMGYVVAIDGTAGLRRHRPEWNTLLEVLRETCSFWREQARVFIAFADDPELPPWK